MADSAERNSMAEKAVQVRERFALRCISKQWDELLQSLLDRRA
jgi:hypothetical protein